MESSNPARSTIDVVSTMIDILKLELNIRLEDNFTIFRIEDYKQWITNLTLVEEKIQLLSDMPTFSSAKVKLTELKGMVHHMVYVVSLKLYVYSVLTHHEELSTWLALTNRMQEIVNVLYRTLESKTSLHVFGATKTD